MIIKMDIVESLELGKEEFKKRESRKADISKTVLSKNIVVNVKKIFEGTSIREQEVYDYMFCVYFSILYSNSVPSIKESLSNFKHYTKKEKENMSILSDFILTEISDVYEKSALSLPIYRMSRNQSFKNLFKNYKMKDLMMGIATGLYEQEFDEIYEGVLEYTKQNKMDYVIMFILAMMSLEKYDVVNCIVATIMKCGYIKNFEIRFMNTLESLIKNVGNTKGYNIEFRKQEEYNLLSQVVEESEERINIISAEYDKIIVDLKEENEKLLSENIGLKDENSHLHNEIIKLKGNEKLNGKSLVLIAYKNKIKYEEYLLSQKPKTVTIIDPFEEQSKLVDVCKNADYVFHMTDKSSHTVSKALKSINANIILINKSNIVSLKKAIDSL